MYCYTLPGQYQCQDAGMPVNWNAASLAHAAVGALTH